MDSFPDTSQGDTSFSLREKEGVLLYLMGIQVCFGRNACFFPAVEQLLYLNSKEEEYSYCVASSSYVRPIGFYEVLIHGQL